MSRVVHFEIHADDPERAVTFYSSAFGWQANKWQGPVDYWLLTTGEEGTPGINGAITRRQGDPPTDGAALNGYACTIDVDDLNSSMEKVKGAGGRIVVEKMAVPGVGWLCYAKDTEDNIFGMMQEDTSAA